MTKIMFLFFSLFMTILSQRAFSYEALSRMGYYQCNQCHVSAIGGGSLNLYGQGIANALSFKPLKINDKEQSMTQGIQFRGANYQSDDVKSTFPMQFDYLNTFRMRPDLTLQTQVAKAPNKIQGEKNEKTEDQVYLRRFFVAKSFSPEATLIVGREFLPVGLNVDDHTAYIKQSGRRSYNDYQSIATFAYQTKSYRLLPFVFAPAGSEEKHNRESGGGITLDTMVYKGQIIGLSAVQGQTQDIRRNLLAVYAKYGWKRYYFLSEFDSTDRKNLVADEKFKQNISFHKFFWVPLDYLSLSVGKEALKTGSPFDEDKSKDVLEANYKVFPYLSVIYTSWHEDIKGFTGNKSMLQLFVNYWW